MKKSLLTIALGLLISVSAMAQSKNEKRAIKTTNQKIEKIEKTLTLSDTEKETYSELNKVYLVNHFDLRELKKSDPAKFKSGIKANKADFMKKLAAALGKDRANEIVKASKGKK